MKILVVGDIMLDHYVYGTVERSSPESGVPIFRQDVTGKETFALGGAGNTAANIAALGVETHLFGACAYKDRNLFFQLLRENHIQGLIRSNWHTTVKRRFVTETGDHLLRHDIEPSSKDFNGSPYLPSIPDFDLIVVADYAKGIVNEKLMERLHLLNIPIIVDPKPANAHLYNKVDMILPNIYEWTEMKRSDSKFNQRHGTKLVITMGDKGIDVLYKGNQIVVPPHPVDVVDVCGAGDTVTAVMAVCTVMGKGLTESAIIAARCAEYVITQSGTVPITKEVFERNL